jgi:hypothetical protein
MKESVFQKLLPKNIFLKSLPKSLHGGKSFLGSWENAQLVNKFPDFYGMYRFITVHKLVHEEEQEESVATVRTRHQYQE